MVQYRAFIKDRTDIGGYSVGSSDLRITSFTIKKDALNKAVSTIAVMNIPPVVKEGDILCVYSPQGKTIYQGVITKLGATIQCDQIESLFDDNWLWNDLKKEILEENIKGIIENDFKNSSDPILKKIFSFDIQVISNTKIKLPSQEPNYVKNFTKFIYELFDKYSIRFVFDIDFAPGQPILKIGREDSTKIKFSNNVNSVLNISRVTEIYETNKLVIYSEDGSHRGTFFGTRSGITDNPNQLDRFPKIKTNIVFSEDDFNIIKAQNLRNQMYNHEIKVEMVLDNKIYNFWSFKLGQEFDIFVGRDYFNTILTGYELRYKNGAMDTVSLTFGKVRTKLEDKLNKNA
ncbi:MAG: hypothetical protein RR945_02165 [Erysipelotrichaceae bacterium]